MEAPDWFEHTLLLYRLYPETVNPTQTRPKPDLNQTEAKIVNHCYLLALPRFGTAAWHCCLALLWLYLCLTVCLTVPVPQPV